MIIKTTIIILILTRLMILTIKIATIITAMTIINITKLIMIITMMIIMIIMIIIIVRIITILVIIIIITIIINVCKRKHKKHPPPSAKFPPGEKFAQDVMYVWTTSDAVLELIGLPGVSLIALDGALALSLPTVDGQNPAPKRPWQDDSL